MKLAPVTSLCLVAQSLVAAASALLESAELEKRACLPALNYTVEIEYVGCYTDPTTPRTLTGASFTLSSNSPENCGFLCGRAGYSYAGVEYTRCDLLYTMRHEKLLTSFNPASASVETASETNRLMSPRVAARALVMRLLRAAKLICECLQ